MLNPFFEPPILNSPYDCPTLHWEHGRWAFAEFTEVYQIGTDFAAKVESEFNKMIAFALTIKTD